MIKNKIYYLLLGIGLGIIITSSLNIVFNKSEKIEYTDEEIKEKAKSLGMISIKENIEKNEKEKKEQESETKAETETEVIEELEQNEESLSKSILITSEDTATTIIEKLANEGIIGNQDEFKELVIKFNLQKKFIAGTYDININTSYEDILKQLIKEDDLKNAGFL